MGTMVIMFVFALTTAGEAGNMALSYPSMDACQADRATVITALRDTPGPSGAAVTRVAVVCAELIEPSST